MWPILILVVLGALVVVGAVLLGALIAERVITDGLTNRRPPARFYPGGITGVEVVRRGLQDDARPGANGTRVQ